MDLELNSDQADLRALAKDLLARRGDLQMARAYIEGRGDSRELLTEIVELGWLAVGLADGDEDPFGLPGLCVLAEQIGAHVAPIPIADGAAAARLARYASGEATSDLANGTCVATLCVLESRAGWSLDQLSTRAVVDGSGAYRVTGTKLGAEHAEQAEVLAVVASVDDQPAALLLPADADGCEIASTLSLDPSLETCTVMLDNVAVSAASLVRGAELRRALAVGAVATAAEAVGAASRALEMAVQYALDRRQFGRPIGSFQALQHRMADMYVKREAAWSTVLYAAAALEEELERSEAAVWVAKAYASRAAREIVEGALQVFGGVGFTWEHDIHLLQRRILACERRFGDPMEHRRRLSAAL